MRHFIFYQEQEKGCLEIKSKNYFLTIQKNTDNYKLSDKNWTNQLDYYKELKKLSKLAVFKLVSDPFLSLQ